MNSILQFFIIGIVCLIILYNLFPKFFKSLYVYYIFALYDILTLGGNTWKLDKAHCSYMKDEFYTPVPLSYYEEFNEAIAPRIAGGHNDVNKEHVQKACDKMLAYLEENNVPYAKPKTLPTVSVNEPDCAKKVRYYVDKNIPFVLRDTNLDVFENMKFDKIVQLFQHEKVLFSPSEPYCEKQVIDEFGKILENKCYISNVTNVFEKYKDLMSKEDEKLLHELSNGNMDSKQMFVGVTQGSGTKMHNAFTNNFFINIEGKKTWTFFNPNNTPMLYPYFSESGVYNASESRFSKHGVSDISKFPLLKYCDYYEYTVEPGEILYNPASWWHAIYNETPITVAISTRWSFPDYLRKMTDYHLLRCGNLRNPKLRDLVDKLYVEYNVLGISVIDEHNVLGNSEESTQIPVWDSITNDSHNMCKNESCHIKWHKT